jgi:hypothetical protein
MPVASAVPLASYGTGHHAASTEIRFIAGLGLAREAAGPRCCPPASGGALDENFCKTGLGSVRLALIRQDEIAQYGINLRLPSPPAEDPIMPDTRL